MGLMNRLGTAQNAHQGDYHKVLCVCSAGILRSPTAALVLSSEPFNFNTRACGLDAYFALIGVDEVLLHWADEIVCMEEEQHEILEEILQEKAIVRPVVWLGIDDNFKYRDPWLMTLIADKYKLLSSYYKNMNGAINGNSTPSPSA